MRSWPQSTADPTSPRGRSAPGPFNAASTPATTTYRLVYNASEAPAAGYGLGWTLVGDQEAGWRWTMSLAARGAGAHTEPRVAKAVAVRVLAQDGVTVEAWADDRPTDEHLGGPAMFRALLHGPSHPISAPRAADEPTRPRIWTWRLRGH
jgi:hypothetical protein